MSRIDEFLALAPVVPVLVVENVAEARPLAEALVAGGLRLLEVTLRTSAALEVIAEMSRVEGAVVGAGTVLNEGDLRASLDAGARFLVSPGLTEPLARPAIASGIPYLPGVATAADVMRGLDLGLDRFKFFPAMAAGGLPALRALSTVFRQARFCPTGGINEATAAEWLAEPSVLAVGGTWVVPKGSLDVRAVREAAARAAALRQGAPAANR